MRSLRFLLGTFLMGTVLLLVGNSCTEQNPVYEKTIVTKDGTPGDLEVFVRIGTVAGPYASSAEVRIYLTEQDRTNNIPYGFNLTDPDDPIMKGALFVGLPFAKYYIQARWRATPTDPWKIGNDESFVPLGKKTQHHITVI
jgi:hypothetical protein